MSERAMAQDLGLTLDIDPGKVSDAGLTQARPVGSIIPQDPYMPDDTQAGEATEVPSLSPDGENDGPDA